MKPLLQMAACLLAVMFWVIVLWWAMYEWGFVP